MTTWSEERERATQLAEMVLSGEYRVDDERLREKAADVIAPDLKPPHDAGSSLTDDIFPPDPPTDDEVVIDPSYESLHDHPDNELHIHHDPGFELFTVEELDEFTCDGMALDDRPLERLIAHAREYLNLRLRCADNGIDCRQLDEEPEPRRWVRGTFHGVTDSPSILDTVKEDLEIAKEIWPDMNAMVQVVLADLIGKERRFRAALRRGKMVVE